MSDDSDTPRLRFTLAHLLYATALIAASIAAFGWAGLGATVIVLVLWAILFVVSVRQIPNEPVGLGIGALAAVCLLLPAINAATDRNMRADSCQHNLRQISLALKVYHAEHGRYPPAVIRDASGKPIHSWRVLILPYMDNLLLFESYDFREPWDGPHNRKLIAEVPYAYQCSSFIDPRKGPGMTCYHAVVAPGTAWNEAHSAAPPAHSLLLMENPRRPVIWTQPDDAAFDEALAILSRAEGEDERHYYQGEQFQNSASGRHIALANSETFVHRGMPQSQAQDWLESGDAAHASGESCRLSIDWGRVVALVAFVVMALLPLAVRLGAGFEMESPTLAPAAPTD